MSPQTFFPKNHCPWGQEKLSGGQPCLGKNVRWDSGRGGGGGGGPNFLRQRYNLWHGFFHFVKRSLAKELIGTLNML